jgi:hypothetical protein
MLSATPKLIDHLLVHIDVYIDLFNRLSVQRHVNCETRSIKPLLQLFEHLLSPFYTVRFLSL